METPRKFSRCEELAYIEAENAFTSEGGFVPPAGVLRTSRSKREARMRASSAAADRTARQPVSEDWVLGQLVHFDGRRYQYNGYRYDRLSDAIAQAALTHRRPLLLDTKGPYCAAAAVSPVPQSEQDRKAMALLGIVVDGGSYLWGEHRYDKLDDAIAYAELMLGRRDQA